MSPVHAIAPPPAAVAGAAVRAGVVETAHAFGPGLVGVLARPAQGSPAPTGVVLLNAGLLHHVGPFRGYVHLARALAAQGYAVLRFDQSGLGDSAASEIEAAECRASLVAAAIDLLAVETGSQSVVLGGICSGADDAFHVGAADRRVAGVLLVDGLAYLTPGFFWRHVMRRLREPRRWRQMLLHHLGRVPRMDDYRDLPAREDATRQLEGMVARGVRLMFVFTGGSYRYFNHAAQLRACFGRAAADPGVALAYWPGCDHTFYLRRDRARLQEEVAAWLRAAFPAAGTGGTAAADR